MKTKILAALAAFTITAHAQVHVVTVDGWAVGHNQVEFLGPENWDGYSATFRLSPVSGGYVWGWWGWGGVEFSHSDFTGARVDFVVVEYDVGQRSGGTQVYAQRHVGGAWATSSAPAPFYGSTWAVYMVTASGGWPAVTLVRSGFGDCPVTASYLEKILTGK